MRRIFNWSSYIKEEFKDTRVDYIQAKLSELEDLFDDTTHDFYSNIDEDQIRVEWGNLESGEHTGYNLDLNTMSLSKDYDDAQPVNDIDEAFNIIEKEIYNYLGISEKLKIK